MRRVRNQLLAVQDMESRRMQDTGGDRRETIATGNTGTRAGVETGQSQGQMGSRRQQDTLHKGDNGAWRVSLLVLLDS
jgi:hypothetical protein